MGSTDLDWFYAPFARAYFTKNALYAEGISQANRAFRLRRLALFPVPNLGLLSQTIRQHRLFSVYPRCGRRSLTLMVV